MFDLDGNVTYVGALDYLQTTVKGGINQAKLTELRNFYNNNNFESDYLTNITYNVVYQNPANTYWYGGVKKAKNKDYVGDMRVGMSEKDANRLIDEWFLGKDLPMPVSGGDTATGKASEDAYNYTSTSGFLFDIGDIQKMSSKAIEVLKDEVLLNKMKDGAHVTAKKYDIKKIIPQYEEVYKLFSK